MAAISANEQPVVATRRQRAAGWMVHAYTATGSVLALLVIIAALDGNTVRAFWILLVALIVDSTDGMLARRLKVKQTIPSLDGARVDDKTDDHYFLGFPSYWNVVAFYVVILDLSPVITAVLLVSCAALVFVPIKYIYPSRTTVFRKLNLTLAGLWVVLYAVILLRLPEPGLIAIGLSLSYIAYYLLASIYLTVRPRFRRA